MFANRLVLTSWRSATCDTTAALLQLSLHQLCLQQHPASDTQLQASNTQLQATYYPPPARHAPALQGSSSADYFTTAIKPTLGSHGPVLHITGHVQHISHCHLLVASTYVQRAETSRSPRLAPVAAASAAPAGARQTHRHPQHAAQASHAASCQAHC